MATNRQIHGKVVLDVEEEGLAESVARMRAALDKLAFDVRIDGQFSRVQLQGALTAEAAKSRGLRVKIDGVFSISQLRRELKSTTAGKLSTRVDATFSRAQVQRALREVTANTPRITVEVDVRRGTSKTVVREAEGIQRDVTEAERRQLDQRETNRLRSEQRVRTIEEKGAQDRLTSRDRTLNRIDVLEEQAANINLRNQQAAALRREVIDAQLRSRLTAQNNAFEQRRILAFERAQRQIEARASKPILQRILVNTDAVNASLADFDRTVSRGLKTSLFAFTAWSAGVSAAVGAAAGAALVSFGRMEEAVARASAVFASGAATEKFLDTGKAITSIADAAELSAARVTAASNKVALETLFNPREAAEGARALAQAGFKESEALSQLGTVARFAQNEQLDFADATEQLTGGLNAAGLATSQLTGLTDKFTTVANATNASASQVAQAFSNQAAGAFRAYGQSVDQALTTIGLFARANLRGLEAGTQAAIVLREINNAATNKAPEAFKKYGIEVGRVNGKLVPFSQTLVQVAQLFGKVQREQGSAGFARLRKELGLTEKSMRGLIILTPQLQKLGPEGVARLERSISGARGATKRQAEVLTDTLSFQFQNFTENITILFQSFGREASGSIKGLLDAFNGSDGLITQVTPSVERLGERFGSLVDRFTEFATSKDAREGARILVDSIRITLIGVRDAFGAFSEAFGDAEGSQSTFVAIATSIRAFAQVSSTVLPAVASILGNIFDLLIDNAGAFETFAKLAVGLFAVRKAYTLLLAPAGKAFLAIERTKEALAATASANTANAISGIAASYGLLGREAKAAAASIELVSVAESSAFPTGGRRGLGAAGARGTAGTGALGAAVSGDALLGLGQASRLGRGGAAGSDAARLGATLEKLNPLVTKATPLVARLGSAFAKVAGPIAIVAVAIEAAIGAVRGFVDELHGSSDASGELGRTLVELAPVIDAVVAGMRTALAIALDILGIVGRVGETVGRSLGGIVNELVIGLGDVVRGFRLLFEGELLGALAAFGDAVINAVTLPFKNAIALVIDLVADVVSSFDKIPGIGGKFRDVEQGLHRASSATRDFRVNMSEAETATGKVKSAVDNVSGSVRTANIKIRTTASLFKATQAPLDEVASAFDGIAASSRIASRAAETAARKSANAAIVAAGAIRTAINAGNIAAGLGQKRGGRTTPIRNSDDVARALGVDLSDPRTQKLLQRQGDIRTGAAATIAHQRALARAAAQRSAAAALRDLELNPDGGLPVDAPTGTATRAAAKPFVDPDETIRRQIDALAPQRKAAETSAAIARALKTGQEGYRATRREVALFQDALPGLDKALEVQRKQVEALDTALTDLRSTQLLGTKAFSDQAFALDQQVKQLQLQKIDLQIGGAADESPAITAIDSQIKALQQQAERSTLVESLQLDPLRRQLEQTFNPTTEASFAAIVAQFKQLTDQRELANAKLAASERTQQLISAAAEGGAARFDKLDQAAQRAHDAIQQASESAGVASTAIGGVATASGAAARNVNRYSAAVESVPSGKGVVDRSLSQINARVTEIAPQFQGAGRRVMVLVTQGVNQGAAASYYPALATIVGNSLTYLRSIAPPAHTIGVGVMDSFLAGIKEGFGSPEKVGSVAWYLNVFIPKWIRENKGPLAYDATILVPAGNAVMEGFGKGLRDGFSQVQGFVKGVGPSLSEYVSTDLFSDRTASIMADIAIGKKPDVAGLLEDLRPDALNLAGFSGPVDGTLGFLHKTLSLKDTSMMAEGLAKLFHLQVTALRDNHSRFTATGNVSDHALGLAADLSNSTGGGDDPGANTPQMLALAKALAPLQGSIIKQLIYQNHDWRTGASIPGHQNHDHVSFLPGLNFSADSGRLGRSPVVDIPGASPRIDAAIGAASAKHGVELALLAAVAKQESHFDPNASSGLANGLFQFTPATARGFGIDPFNIEQAADGGARYLKNLLGEFGGRYDLALAGYNAGPNAVHRYGDHVPPFSETRNYVRLVTSYLDQFRKQFGGFREAGGPVDAGKWHVVGEKGPEIFTPSRSGSIIPAGDTARIMAGAPGGSGMVYHDNRKIEVTTAATDAEAVAALVDARTRVRLTGVNFR